MTDGRLRTSFVAVNKPLDTLKALQESCTDLEPVLPQRGHKHQSPDGDTASHPLV
jgi:hypothetical protein